MLVHEKELEELVVLPGDGDEPGRRQREVEHEARGQVEPPPHREIARERGVDDERAARQHEADQSFRQRGSGERGRGEPHPKPTLALSRFLPLRDHGGAEAECEKEGQSGVQRHDLRDEDVADRGRERESGIRPERDAAQRVPGTSDRQYGQESRERRPQSRRPFVHAEVLERGSRQPVLDRRFLEVLEPVQARRHPVARRGHLARNLGVTPFVGVREEARVERDEPQERDCGDECPEHRNGWCPGAIVRRRSGRRRVRWQEGWRKRPGRGGHRNGRVLALGLTQIAKGRSSGCRA